MRHFSLISDTKTGSHMIKNQVRKPAIFNPHQVRPDQPRLPLIEGDASAVRKHLSLPSLFSWVAFLCPIFSGYAAAQSADTTSTEVTALVPRFIQAHRSCNPTAHKDVTAGNYIEVSPLHEVGARQVMLGFYDPSQRVDVPSASVSDQNIRVVGDTAMTSRGQYVVAASSQPSHEVAMRATLVAMRYEGV
jgi:hypothetical protein